MPSPTIVSQFISGVESGNIMPTFERFYAAEVVMQNNKDAAVVGKDANRTREAGFVAYVSEVHENRARSVIIDGDRVAIEWVFDFTGVDGTRLRMEQVAVQQWKNDQIVSERFFYDASTLGQVAPADESLSASA